MESLRIGIINKTINMLDFLLADDAGIYREHGLDVTFDTVAGLESVRALQAGDLDVIVSIGAMVRAIMTEDASLKLALLVHRNAPHWVMARAGIGSAEDLRGKVVQAAQPGSEPDVMVRKWLAENGLDPESDVTLTYVRAHPGWTDDGPDPAEDAVIARTLEQEVLEARGFTTLTELCERYPNTLIHGLVLTERTVAERPDAVRALVAAHQETARWIDEARPEVLDVVQARWGVSPERAMRAVSALQGKLVARLDTDDFGPVIEASAAATGQPAITPDRFIARLD